MWMSKTYIPLDMLFIDGEGRVTQIAESVEAKSTEKVRSREPVLRVIWKVHGLKSHLVATFKLSHNPCGVDSR